MTTHDNAAEAAIRQAMARMLEESGGDAEKTAVRVLSQLITTLTTGGKSLRLEFHILGKEAASLEGLKVDPEGGQVNALTVTYQERA